MEIELGKGKVFLCSVIRKTDGVPGILFRNTNTPHPINSPDPQWEGAGKSYDLQEGDCVVWLGSLESARVLQDRVNIEIVRLVFPQEIEVKSKEVPAPLAVLKITKVLE